MRVLVLGAAGMLGHQVAGGLGARYEVRATVRGGENTSGHAPGPVKTYFGVDVRDSDRIRSILQEYRPAAVINAVGIVKQRDDAKRSIPSIEINALFPHRLSEMASTIGARVIQISTDCVFSGERGGYVETDRPDPVDLYGYTKLLGELVDDHCLTLRTSIIGLELEGRQGLVEWALSQTGGLSGYHRALYSGLTTTELTRVIDLLLKQHPTLHGLWHVASEPISKYDLLVRLFALLGRTDVAISPSDAVICDRTLRAEAFAEATGYAPPSWDAMLDELARMILEREGASHVS